MVSPSNSNHCRHHLHRICGQMEPLAPSSTAIFSRSQSSASFPPKGSLVASAATSPTVALGEKHQGRGLLRGCAIEKGLRPKRAPFRSVGLWSGVTKGVRAGPSVRREGTLNSRIVCRWLLRCATANFFNLQYFQIRASAGIRLKHVFWSQA
jgi:hypothetical protein